MIPIIALVGVTAHFWGVVFDRLFQGGTSISDAELGATILTMGVVVLWIIIAIGVWVVAHKRGKTGSGFGSH